MALAGGRKSRYRRRTGTVASPMRQAFADGAAFGTTEGDPPWRVLALPGWMHTVDDYGDVMRSLQARDVSSAAIDLPGFGGATAEPEAAMGARGYAEAVAPVLEDDRLGPDPVVIIGHSYGGRVAVCLASVRPERVRGLVLTGVPLLRGAPPARPPLGFRVARWANRRRLLPDDRMEALRRKRGSADYRNATGVMRDVLVTAVNETYEEELRALACPVELVWGADDDQVGVSVAEQAGELIGSRSHLTVVPGAGHQVPRTAPEALVDAACRVLG